MRSSVLLAIWQVKVSYVCGPRVGFATIANPMTKPPPATADRDLDATGLLCPEPLMIVRNAVRDMQAGQVLHVIATDPSTERDFNNFCRFMGHEMLASQVQGNILAYWIRKGGA